VTAIYRDNDFILARAFLPEQSFAGGVVTVEVLAGELEQVLVAGNERYSDPRVAMPFADLLGKPVRKSEIESAMLSLGDYPGLTSDAVFAASDAFGATDLTLAVEEQHIDFSASVDNYGTEYTGNGRARATLDWFNPVGIGDLFSLNVLQTFDPDEGTYGGISYEVPLNRYDWTLGASYNRNAYDVSGNQAEDIGLGGDSSIGALYLRRQLKRTRTFSAGAYTGLSIKEATIDNVAVDGDDPEDNLTIISFGIDLKNCRKKNVPVADAISGMMRPE
jgi:hemolysin activation/secretion protein